MISEESWKSKKKKDNPGKSRKVNSGEKKVWSTSLSTSHTLINSTWDLAVLWAKYQPKATPLYDLCVNFSVFYPHTCSLQWEKKSSVNSECVWNVTWYMSYYYNHYFWLPIHNTHSLLLNLSTSYFYSYL